MAQTDANPATMAADLIEAFNDADWERVREVLADDVLYDETGTGRRVQGAEPYLDLLRAWKAGFPDARGAINSALASADMAAQELVWEGTHTGPLETPAGTLEATGARINVAACFWMRVEDGKAVELRHYLDVMTMLQQVGAMQSSHG